jgi:hypothetical protein
MPMELPPIPTLSKTPAYWEALGRFIQSFAGVELTLFQYTTHLAKIDWNVARILLGGEQVDRLIDHTRKLMDTASVDTDIQNKTNIALTQLKSISTVRNLLVHYVSIERQETGSSISWFKKYHRDAPLSYNVSTKDLENMTVDLDGRLSHLLLYCLTRVLLPDDPKNEAKYDHLNDAWRYKAP